MPGKKRQISAIILLTCYLAAWTGLQGMSRAIGDEVWAADIGIMSSIAGTPAADADADQTGIPMPVIEHSSLSALVIETGRQRSLYASDSQSRVHLPSASKVMTALIACERLSLDVQVTISKIAADASELEESPDGIQLLSGDKFPLDYLLTRLIYFNSDAAALAIAEQIANVEDRFVEIMNTRAAAFRMTSTVFMNSTGQPVFETPDEDWPTDLNPPLLQYTTLSDMALLLLQATANPVFLDILTTPTRYFVLNDSTLAIMRNEMSNVWTRSEGLIAGVFYSQWANRSYMAAIGTVNNINLVVVTAMGNPARASDDLMAIFKSCESYYVSSPLVVAGDTFTGAQEQTIDGESFGLVFKNTVYYIHPRDNDFLKQTIRYNTLGPFSRPILRSMTIGQVVFELLDGTQVAVDVSPDRQILSSISIVDRALSELQRNTNLASILIVAGSSLILIMLTHVILGVGRLIQLMRLIVLERRGRRL